MPSSPRGPVAHLIAPAPAGGAESVILALAAAAPDRTRVITLNQHGQDAAELPFTRQLREHGIAVDEVRVDRRQYRAEAREAARLVRTHGISLLHSHGYHGNIVGWLARDAAGVPVIGTAHGYLDRDFKERLYGRLDRWVMRRLDAAVAVSNGLERILLAHGHRRDRLAMIRNGMPAPPRLLDRAEARALLGLRGDGPVVGWIGRLSIEKGADLFVDAIAATAPPVTGVLVGDGAERERLAERIGASARVVLAGQRPDAARLLSAFDLLAISSRTEGTPMVVLEAIGAGVPIVSFRVGGIPDVIDESSGWLVPALDTAALARAIDEAVGDPDEARRRAARASERATAELGIDAWLGRVWALYEQVWSRRA